MSYMVKRTIARNIYQIQRPGTFLKNKKPIFLLSQSSSIPALQQSNRQHLCVTSTKVRLNSQTARPLIWSEDYPSFFSNWESPIPSHSDGIQEQSIPLFSVQAKVNKKKRAKNFSPPLTRLHSGSLPHRLGRDCRILSTPEREREGVSDTPSWVTGPRVGAGGGVVAMATVGVEAARAAARTRSR
jgi:hypothetical protein